MNRKTQFVCQECGYISSKWLGRCPECAQWNSFIEEREEPSKKVEYSTKSKASPIESFKLSKEVRFNTPFEELDRVLGGGIVSGSLVLVGGEPGIGKSTLLLQVSIFLASLGKRILYVSGEESPVQIRMRAERIGTLPSELYLLTETIFEDIEAEIVSMKPELVVIDSIQTMNALELSSAPGSLSQVREVTSKLMRLAKQEDIAVVILGHVTKSGSIAGPKILEHIVDTVLYFEGDSNNLHRILRSVKNRFGSTHEIGLFSMTGKGLQEIKDPSELFMSHTERLESGTVIFPSIEGTRPIFLEIQSLVSSSNFGNPRRASLGLDYNKLVMSLAILEKKRGLPLQDQDIYVNAVGGISLREPAMTLPMMVSIASSFLNKPIDRKTVIFGEVGLLGEIRSVPHIEKRIEEAKRLGYEKVIAPPHKALRISSIEVFQVAHIDDVFELLF